MRVTLPLPPSDNHVYFTVKRRRVKTSEAERYVNLVRAAVAEQAIRASIPVCQDVPDRVIIMIYFDRMEQLNWKRSGAGRRFLKLDVANRQKLLIDAVMDALGIDDSCIMNLQLLKYMDAAHPRVEFDIEPLPQWC